MSGSYEQRQKRKAIKQIQQRSKRLSNSKRNPFSVQPDKDFCSDQSDKDLEVFDPPKQFSPSNNPFAANMAAPIVEAPENIPKITPTLSEAIVFKPTTTYSTLVLPGTARRLSVGRRNPATKQVNAKELSGLDCTQRTIDLQKPDKFTRKVGTCLYMCSFEEYNKRLSQDIYSSHETENGRFVHHLAVKEYVRASADQEESKPEDLRPSIILLKTVQYLCLQLIEKKSANFEEVYDFVWNRMRAIRKDITQQKLCDTKTVTVLETIVRFHIFSAYLMAGSNFEQKYNNENLEKTLTSLRHLYSDMKMTNQVCPNEGEFRMYYILLNLNNGQVMYEMYNLSPAIRNSGYVKFAISCYIAYNSNNFVRFFRLFKAGPLLSCCLIYRYINNIRQKAFIAIINSNTTKQTGSFVVYPITKLQSMLLCETVKDTITFVKSMEVEVDESGESAVLRNRIYEVNKDKLTVMMSLIDKKIVRSLGEIMFTGSLLTDSVLGAPVPPSPISLSSSIKHHPNIDEILTSISTQIIAQVCLTEVVSISTECIASANYVDQSKIDIIMELLDEVCVQTLRDELIGIKNNVRKQAIAHTKELYKDIFVELLNTLLVDIFQETIIEQTGRSFIESQYSDLLTGYVKSELRQLLRTDAEYLSNVDSSVKISCDNILEELVSSVVSDQLQLCVSEAADDLIREKKAKLRQTLNKSMVQKRYFFKIWKKRYSNIYAKRHTLDNIPPRIVPSSSSDVLRNLLRSNKSDSTPMQLAFSDMAHIDLTSPTKIYEKKREVRQKLQLRMNLLEEALSVKGIPLKCFSQCKRGTVYLTLCLNDTSSQIASFILDCFGIVAPLKLASGHACERVVLHKTILNVQIVDLAISSPQLVSQACKCSHMVVIQTSSCQLANLLRQFQVPKVLISPDQLYGWDGVYIKQPASMNNIRCCNLYKALDLFVNDALQIEIPFPKYKLLDIRDLIQSVVCTKLTDLLLAKQVVLNENIMYSVDPNSIISFYNSIIRYLSNAVLKDELMAINWPSLFDKRTDINIDWNNKMEMKRMSSEILSLCVSSFRGDPESAEDCLDYVSSLKAFSSHFLIARISSIINQTGVQWCIVLNQIIHHIIENTIFETSYTVLLEDQLVELNSLNGERMVEQSIVYNELANDLEDYKLNAIALIEEDITEMWASLSHYEAKMSNPLSIRQPIDYLHETYDQFEELNKDIKVLESDMYETEHRLQNIVKAGQLPSYLMKSPLFSKKSSTL